MELYEDSCVVSQRKKGSSESGNRQGNRQCACGKFHMNARSGKCSTCAISCSLYIPSGPLASSQEMKTDNEFPDEASKEQVASQYLGGGGDALSSMSNVTIGRYHSSCGTSNGQSACSTQCSLAENEVIEDNLRASGTSNDVEMLVKVDTSQTSTKKHDLCTIEMCHNYRIVCGQHQKQKVRESFDDNISCISCSEHTDRLSGDHSCETIRHNSSRASASVDCCPAMVKVENGQPAWCCLASDQINVPQSNGTGRLVEVTKESPQAIGVWSSDFSDEQVASSETKASPFCIDDHVYEQGNGSKMLEPSILKSLRLPSEVAKCSDERVDPEQIVGIRESTIWKPGSQCQPLECSGGSDHMEDEVKVCDICGDVGWEELLATCSKCNDGAEHTYCMHVKLEKVPEGYWICEDCMVEEENEKKREHKLEQEEATRSKAPVLSKLRPNSGNLGSANNKNKLKSDTKHLVVDDSGTIESSASHLSAKRLFSSLAISPVEKQGIGRNSSNLTKRSSETVMSQGTSFKNLDKRKTTSTCEGSLRSKSFSSGNSEAKYLLNDVEMQNKDRKVEVTKMLHKSASFNSVGTDTSHAISLPSNFSFVKGLKRLRHGKDQAFVGSNSTVALHNSSKRSLEAENCSNKSTASIKVLKQGETRLPILSEPILNSSLRSVGENASRDLQNMDQNKFVGDTRDKACYSTDEACSTKGNGSVGTPPSGELSCMKALPCSATRSSGSWMSAIPEHNCMWKGEFVVLKNGRPFSFCDGIQAHLSTTALAKVFQTMHEFPPKILLELVPRLDMWPIQFLEEQPKEDNITLYFFAKDLESYERSYRSLLDCLINEDLCLKGNFDGVELLIFSSNLLQEKSQRWNSLLFFWGLLKGTAPNGSQNVPAHQEGIWSYSFNSSLSDSHNSCSSVHSSVNLSSSNATTIMQRKSTPLISSMVTIVAPAIVANFSQNEVSSHQKFSNPSNLDGQLSAADSLIKHQQLSKEIMHNISSQRDKRDSIRRLEIDLNKESDTNGACFGEDPARKRLKVSEETFSYKGFSDASILPGKSVFGFGSSGIGGGSPVAYDNATRSQKSSFLRGKTRLDSATWKSGMADWLEPGIPSLELSLGSEEKSAEQGAVKMLPGIVGYKVEETNHSVAVRGDQIDEPSLSLSLSLHTYGNEQPPERAQEKMSFLPRFHAVDTSLSLSCGRGSS